MLTGKMGIHLFPAALLFLLIPATASAQRTDYSDNWMVATSTSVSASGCGITEENYSSYGHEYAITTTLTSPDYSRSVTGYGGGGSCMNGNIQCSRADVSLPVLLNGGFDGGEYFVESVHQGVCPYWNMELEQKFTTAAITIGASISVLTKAAMSNFYTKVANCNVRCPTDGINASRNYGQYILSVVPYTYAFGYRCSMVNAIYSATAASQCVDVEGWVPIPGTPF